MKHLILSFLLVFNILIVSGQISEVSLNVGIDTIHNKNNKDTFNLWKNYLLSNPHKISDNPYWSDIDKSKWKSYDFLRSEGFWNPSLYGLGLKNIVLSITKYGELQIIKSMFYDFYDKKFITYAITNVVVRNKRLTNYTQFYTNNWPVKKTKFIDYIYYPKYIFSDKKAEEANLFIKKISSLFDINLNFKITYYIANNCDEINNLKGFEYTLGMGKTPNKCAYYDIHNNIVYTYSFAGENHKHELIHLINSKYPKSNYFLLSGLSVYTKSKNSHLGESFSYHIKKIYNYFSKHPELNFNDLSYDIDIENTEPTYFIGAILVHLILKKGGIELLKKALKTVETKKDLIKFIKSIYKTNNIDPLIKKEFKLATKDFVFLIDL